MKHMMAMMLPAVRGVQDEEAAQAGAKRAAVALPDGADAPVPPRHPPDSDDDTRIEIDAAQTASADERLRELDFEQISAADAAAARRMLARLSLPVTLLATRRW